jgi:methylenetetrahydrofolate reductase (NADPH)
MKISELLSLDKVGISCEVFPPKKGSELNNAKALVREIAAQGSDFISVTYGAGGTTAGETVALASEIESCGVPALAHLTCINTDEAKVDDVLGKLKEKGIHNVMALRGDKLPGHEQATPAFLHASDLVKKIKASGDFCIGGACYPQGHPEANSLNEDIEHTKIKVDSGCDFLVTQMIFDNSVLYNYMYRLMSAGVNIPVIPGIMPVTNAKQIKHICDLSGTPLPPHYQAIVEKFSDDPVALKQAGIAYAMGQVVDLVANGFKNVHIYTMNKPDVVGSIVHNLSALLK